MDYIRLSKRDFVLSSFHWWNLWYHINNMIFNNATEESISGIIKKLSIATKDGSQKTGNKRFEHIPPDCSWPIQWSHPPKNTLKINNGCSTKQNGMSCIAFTKRKKYRFPHILSQRAISPVISFVD